MTMLSFKKAESTTIRETPTNEVVVGLILDAVNIVLLCFQFELKMGVHAASTNKKIFEVHKFWYFFRRVNFILIFFKKELASLLSAGKPFSGDIEG